MGFRWSGVQISPARPDLSRLLNGGSSFTAALCSRMLTGNGRTSPARSSRRTKRSWINFTIIAYPRTSAHACTRYSSPRRVRNRLPRFDVRNLIVRARLKSSAPVPSLVTVDPSATTNGLPAFNHFWRTDEDVHVSLLGRRDKMVTEERACARLPVSRSVKLARSEATAASSTRLRFIDNPVR